MPTIGLTGTTGIGITKQIAAEGDCLPTNPVTGEFACLFVEARGGLPRGACQYRVCRFWCLYATGLDGPGHGFKLQKPRLPAITFGTHSSTVRYRQQKRQ
jgi:hypothetical protein